MKGKRATRNNTDGREGRQAKEFSAASRQIMHYAHRGLLRADFMREVSELLLNFSGCDAVGLWVKDHNKDYRYLVTPDRRPPFRFEITSSQERHEIIGEPRQDSDVELLCREIAAGGFDASLPFFTSKGSFWTPDAQKTPFSSPKKSEESPLTDIQIGGEYRSLLLIPITVEEERIGVMQLRSRRPNYFIQEEVELYEELADDLGVALVHRRAVISLRERVKELTCLSGIARLAAQPGIALKDILQNIVELLPPAWLYPEIASARIMLDGLSYTTPGFGKGAHKQAADIIVASEKRGLVEMTYSEERPELDEGPFLKEERNLIDTVAKELALIVERRQSQEEKLKLQEQLRHADRLATIGQLAAGVAHELNEPLGSILGFAQLAKKSAQLPKQAAEDIEKIVSSSLHAREVVKKLLIFARQMPTRKSKVNLNQTVEEGLYFLESRCAKDGIDLVRSLSPNLPEIAADHAQLQQVLVNLVVNAIQAMPNGGKLTVQTLAFKDHVSLIVEDTGVGMSAEVKKQIFIPFFTTKEVGKGTGLGLSVVHGIVSSHGGSIEVESEVSQGTRFEIRFPITEGAHVAGY